jgi:hypothetical protein
MEGMPEATTVGNEQGIGAEKCIFIRDLETSVRSVRQTSCQDHKKLVRHMSLNMLLGNNLL